MGRTESRRADPGRATQVTAAHRDVLALSATISVLPVACLLLAQDATAIEANEKWAGLSGVPVRDSLGDGWLQAVGAFDRIALRALVRDAAAEGVDGSADIWLGWPGAEQWSRWSWGPVPSHRLLVAVVSLAVSPPPKTDSVAIRWRTS